MEVNVETPQIFNAIRAVSKDAIICAGGIITSIQAQAAIDAGAKDYIITNIPNKPSKNIKR